MDRVRSLTSELQQVYQALVARVGAGVGGGGFGGGASPQDGSPEGTGSTADDDVVDADFDRS
ncbi:MAG TPA: hypothetical protein VE155_00195 [Pseudonocardiaceae bacterium]|nr:hypothetical protein [Pseudonocardiaceae bacterium]